MAKFIASLAPIMTSFSGFCTPPWRIRLKARVDIGDQTTEFIPFEAIRMAISTYFYLFLGINYAF